HTLHPIATHDLSTIPTAPKFEVEKPRRRSLSPMTSVSTTDMMVPSSSKTMYSPPPLTWRTAFQDAKAGIYYTKDSFPSSTFLPPPFSREPVKVEPAERVEVLDEVDDYAVRVRVLRTGAVGLIPMWNTEGALERLTRINTAFNEAATCPVEARALRRRDSESSASAMRPKWNDAYSAGPPAEEHVVSLSHIHARCIPFATRVRYPDYYGASSPFSDYDEEEEEEEDEASSSDSGSDSPHSPSPSPSLSRHSSRAQPHVAVYEPMPRTLEQGGISAAAGHSHSHSHSSSTSTSSSLGSGSRAGGGRRKSVNFAEGEQPLVVFRYPSEQLVGAFLGEKEKEQARGERARQPRRAEGEEMKKPSEQDGEEEWWWRGWEEMREELGLEDGEEEQDQEEEEEEE
ncbi:hypothetical protein C8Q74DRAFT_1186560, partial [Fomes fomentarius]